MIGSLHPYPAYKDSGVPWLGSMPAHWTLSPGRSAFREKKVKNTGMIESQVLSLSYGRIVVKPPEKLHGLVPESFETYQVVDPGDIIIRSTDLQNDWNSLRTGLVRDRGIITSAYLCLNVNGTLIPKYAHLLLHTYDLKKIYYGLGSGLRQNLDFRDFKYLPLLVPPLPEQQAIARFLDHIDRRINRYIRAKRKLIALLNEQKQAIIHRAVTRGLDPDVPLKPSGVEWLGEIPAHWELVPLKHVAIVQTGITLGKNYGAAELIEYPYLRVANVQDGYLDLKSIKTIWLPQHEAAASMLQDGDVLMTEGGDIDKLGRGYIWRGEIPGCIHQNHIFAVRSNSAYLLPDYLVILMTSLHGRTYFQRTAKQTTNLASTNSTTLRAFPLPLPRTSEQKGIMRWIEDKTAPLEQGIQRAQLEIDLIREYRTRLIADVVTGKLDVRGVALPEEGEADADELIDEDLGEQGLDGEGEELDAWEDVEDGDD